MQFSNMFKNIGRIGIEMYLLFQHHTTLDILRNVPWYVGPAITWCGFLSERQSGPTTTTPGPRYLTKCQPPPSVQHCLWMVSVPLIYPRLETAEHIVQTVATG
jgi:hypothetical protein